jgi:O-antigen ligase
MLVAAVIVSPVADRVSYDYLKDDQNLLTRILYWQRAIQYIQDSPIVGVGIGSFNDSSVVLEHVAPGISVKSSSEKFFGENHAHNIILHVLAEQGVLGLALLSWFWLSLLRRRPSSYIQFRPNELEDFKLMKRAITAIFIYLLAASMLGNNLLTISTAFIFYILAAAFVSSTVRNSKNNKILVPGHQLASM